MRIVFCITELATGGAENCLAALAAGLDPARFSVEVVSLAGPPQAPATIPGGTVEPAPGDRPAIARHESLPATAASGPIARLEQAGIRPRFLGATRARQAPWILNRLTAELRRLRPDVVQTFLYHANIAGRLAAWRAGVPRVYSGIRVAEPRSRWRLRLDRWTTRLVDRHVCVSQAVADFSARVARLPAQQLTVIPNGIDVARWDATAPADLQSLSVAANRRAILFVGRLDRQKGVDLLIQHAPRLLAAAPEHDLLLAGDGPLRPWLDRQVAQPALAGRVHLLGLRSDVPALMRASDLVVLPSRWEGMPNAVLEAMAARRPVLATDVEGARELLGPSSDEQLVPAGDMDRFVERAAAILDDPARAARLADANRHRAAAEFSLDRMIAAYARLYEGRD